MSNNVITKAMFDEYKKEQQILQDKFRKEQQNKFRRFVVFAVALCLVLSGITGVASYTLAAGDTSYTPKDVNWNVENVESALNNLNVRINQLSTHYSTEEQVVGEWIDGKPLYQRTLLIASSYTSEVAIPNNGVGISVTGVSDIFLSDIKPTLDKIVHIEMDTNNRFYSGSSYSHYYQFRFNADNGHVSSVDNYNVGYQENIALYPGTSFTFKYTKTTD